MAFSGFFSLPSRRNAPQRNEERMKSAEKLDGGYILRTSRTDLTGDQIWRTYVLLTRVEKGFEYLKSDLGLRPGIFILVIKKTQLKIP